MDAVAADARAAIRQARDGEVYPQHILAGYADALVLFAAGFLGRQDALWVADAGLQATCVDVRAELLAAMEPMYPASWEFVEDDAYDFAAWTTRRWDIVSIDCPSGHFARCVDMIDTWCRLARRYVILGAGRGQATAPDGWRHLERRHRTWFAGGTYWDVFEATT